MGWDNMQPSDSTQYIFNKNLLNKWMNKKHCLLSMQQIEYKI